MGSAAIGKPVAMSPDSPQSLNFWPTLPQCIHMMSISNCAISHRYHNLTAATSHPEKCLWDRSKALRLPPSILRWQILTHAGWSPALSPSGSHRHTLGTETSAPSVEFMDTDSHPSANEVPIRRSTRIDTKAIRASQRHSHAEKQLRGAQQEIGRPGNMKASAKKPLLRRSKRLQHQ